MVTLTFRKQPQNPKAIFDKWKRALRRDYDTACQWGWIMEYQRREVVHYHIFFGADFVSRNGIDRSGSVETILRRGVATSILRGSFDDWATSQWISATEDHSDAFRKFQEGGICEYFRSPDGAAKYVAKEASKRHQKALPEGVDGGSLWWWISKPGKPQIVGWGELVSWPFGKVLSRVFEREKLADHLGMISVDGPVRYEDLPPRESPVEGVDYILKPMDN